jgi:1-deoxy-D-xylulose 5-phosphate reductoisomerase
MRSIPYLVFVILLAAILSGCRSAATPTATDLPESMKGYELYSWQEGSQWRFSLLVGTNREKTLSEIQSVDVVLRGMDALKATLERIPAGQYVTWSTKETLSFPPDEMIRQVEQICTDRGLILSIVR